MEFPWRCNVDTIAMDLNTDKVLEATGRLRQLDPINPIYVDEIEAYALYLFAGRPKNQWGS